VALRQPAGPLSRWRFALLYALAWTPFAVIYAVNVGIQASASLADALYAAITTTAAAALLGLGVWWLGAGVDRALAERWWAALIHLLGAPVYSALWSGWIVLVMARYAPPPAYDRYISEAIGWQFLIGIVVYGFVAGASHAVHASGRVRAQQARAARADALRADAELRALRGQLNPHFLFNTLHSITALVRSDPPAAERALERLAALLRHVLEVNRGSMDEISLADELDFVRAYVALERLRLGDRLRFVEEIHPDSLDCAILAFTLQPLVENALRHGIAPRAGGGTLRITAHVDDHLVLEVADDGNGAARGVVDAPAGLGLHTVRERLRVHYGPGASCDISTGEGDGFVARVRLPASPAPRRGTPAGPAFDRPAAGRGAGVTA
jgi:signal transduction histidine kinase